MKQLANLGCSKNVCVADYKYYCLCDGEVATMCPGWGDWQLAGRIGQSLPRPAPAFAFARAATARPRPPTPIGTCLA